MGNRDLLKQFADGTQLNSYDLDSLVASNFVGYCNGEYKLTTAGSILLGTSPYVDYDTLNTAGQILLNGIVPPGDSASCPDEDMVNHPPHYKQGGIECIDAIRAALTDEEYRGYCKGNALKYIWRSGKKGDANEDLQKADWYLNRLVKP